jgi:hypothetical protein
MSVLETLRPERESRRWGRRDLRRVQSYRTQRGDLRREDLPQTPAVRNNQSAGVCGKSVSFVESAGGGGVNLGTRVIMRNALSDAWARFTKRSEPKDCRSEGGGKM